MQPELAGKKVELLKEVLPALSRIAALWTSAHPAHMRELEEAQAAARRMGVSLEPYDVTRLTNLERAFADIKSDRPHAILTFFDYRTLAYRSMIAEFAVNQRLPTIFSSRLFVDAGGLMSYGPDARKASIVLRATWTEFSGAQTERAASRTADALRTGGEPQNRDDPRNQHPALGPFAN